MLINKMKKQPQISLQCRTKGWGKSVCIVLLLSAVVFRVTAQQYTEKKLPLIPLHYTLDVHIDYTNKKLSAVCELTVMNISSEKTMIIPLLIYRLTVLWS